ncbi:dynamin family protein [Roseobacter sp. YSTF-M11]|uniref:Dynamin family protein n=1 Tax=Roseobacter insulae TaxID=2859783 RepID=A0A9X1K2C1_9RHOB|nr:dynamin family protein [Roseobacter insulae]MBW4710084.1 dynamin family protein [Roseobacter insulae]
MNVLNASASQEFQEAKQSDLLRMGLEPLQAYAKSETDLRTALKALQTLGDESTAKRADRLLRQLEAFEPSVTMIGQIKSGKTSLVNAMVGQSDLLPADVNPWTSVVTSLHLHPETPGFESSASFQFFDEDEWDRLISGGGRIGELASRAGADDELEKIKAQAAEMREKSRVRLGQKFEMLLGQQRDYGYLDKDLIERYVCLGEEPDAEDPDISEEQGRFADITKSADLSLQRMSLPVRLCLRDTPGVNDTFMMREQITIRSIRDSRICVVVLSAHQALSSTDLALIRLISHVKSRDVVIFVNRVDELSDPASQIPQIAQSIQETLARHKGPEDAHVVFGSALWASYALDGRLDALPQSSADAMLNWSTAADLSDVLEDSAGHDPVTLAWALSGVPSLQNALSMRIAEGVGAATLQRIASSGLNLANTVLAADKISAAGTEGLAPEKLNRDDAIARMAEITQSHRARLDEAFADILEEFSERMNRVQASFLDRATASLIVHLEQYGDHEPWTYDPAGLRMLLGSSHKVLARKSKAAFEAATQEAASELTTLYHQAFGFAPGLIDVSLPRAPQVPPPVSLGRTIALDLNGSWWKRWWLHRRGYKAYAANFYELIKTETNPFVDELRDDLAQEVRQTACDAMDVFLAEQASVFEAFDRMAQSDPKELQAQAAKNAPPDHKKLLADTLKTLNEYAS